MNLYSRFFLGFFLAAFLGNLGGCAIQNAGEAATRGAVRAVLDKELRDQVRAALFEDPKLRDLTNAALEDAITHIMEAIRKSTDPLIQTALQSAVNKGGDLWKELQPTLQHAMQEAVQEATHMAALQLRRDLQVSLGPAVQQVIRSGVQAAVQEGLAQWPKTSEQLRPVLKELVHELAQEAAQGFIENLKKQSTQHSLPPVQELVHMAGVGLGEGIGEGLARSVVRDPMRPVVAVVAVTLGTLLLINLVLVLILWRKYLQTNKSLVLFASQVMRTGADPTLAHAVEAAHAAVHHQGWLQRFLQRYGFVGKTTQP